MSNFNLHRNTNGESYNDLVDETTDITESKVEIKKKRFRHRQTRKVAIKNEKMTKFLP